MKLSKKQLALIALVAILVVTNITFAVLYMTKNVHFTGGVSVIGSIEVYDDTGTTPLTNIDFDNFTGGVALTREQIFFINNTGNQPVYVYWNISSSSITWEMHASGAAYVHSPGGQVKYVLSISNATYDLWEPETQGVRIDVDEGSWFTFHLEYTGNVNTAEIFSFTVSFNAEDA